MTPDLRPLPGRARAIRACAQVRGAPELAIIEPALNKRDNVPELVERFGPVEARWPAGPERAIMGAACNYVVTSVFAWRSQ
jgi:hypothetical protein